MTHYALDLDDVVLDFVVGVLDAVEREYGVRPVVDRWNLHEVLDPVLGRSWWSWLHDREWLWATFPAVPGAVGGVETLRRRGHYVELVTSKPGWAEHNVWKWLGKWRPAFNRVTVVGPKDRKVDWTDADVLVDDRPKNCYEFKAAGRFALLFDRPHNRDSRSGLVYVRGWRGVLEWDSRQSSESQGTPAVARTRSEDC